MASRTINSYIVKMMLLVALSAYGCGDGTQTGSNPSAPETSNPAQTDAGVPASKDPVFSCDAGSVIRTLDCKAEIAHSLQATKTESCSADGKSVSTSACNLNACEPGFLLKENACVPAACQPGTAPDSVACTGENANSSEATKSRTCNAEGTGYDFGACTVAGCAPGYFLDENQCKPMSCSPGVASPVSCVAAKPGSADALQTRTCNALGSDYVLSDDCTVVSCAGGYHKVENSCVANTCEPSAALGNVSCVNEIPGSAEALKPKSCNALGSDYVFGSCAVVSCSAGYHQVGNSCVADICTPGATDSISCTAEIPFSTAASKTRTCDGGAAYTFGSCVATACEQDYTVANNVCVPIFPRLTAVTATADQQVNLSLGAFPNGVTEVRVYRFTSQPANTYWECLSSCTQIATFKAGNAVMSGSFTLVDTAPAANTTYWYRYASVSGGQTHNDLHTATAASSATAISFRHSVFLTSSSWKAGGLGGLAGADAKCADAAAAANLAGTNYRAVLASNTQLAWERAQVSGPVKTLNGTLVAGTSRQFAHGYWASTDLTTQTGASVSASTYFWLGDMERNCGLWSAPDTSSIPASEEASYAQIGWKGLTINSSSGTCNLSGFISTRKLLCIGDH